MVGKGWAGKGVLEWKGRCFCVKSLDSKGWVVDGG